MTNCHRKRSERSEQNVAARPKYFFLRHFAYMKDIHREKEMETQELRLGT